jgi:phosphatidylserine decarboxylase
LARARLEQWENGSQKDGEQREYQEGRTYEGNTLSERIANAWKTTPVKWYPIPALLGAIVLVGIQARRNYVADKKGNRGKVVDENGNVVTMSGPWTVYVLGALPLNAISRAWGWANNLTLPMWFRPYGFRFYAYLFGCNLDEMKDPDLTHYSSLGEFFYRELKNGVRPLDEAPLISPADGTVLHFGSIQGRRVEQVKGVTYSLDALLGLTSDPYGYETSGKPDAAAIKAHEIKDDSQFAKVNGIEYSLDRLLGDEKSRSSRIPRGWTRFVNYRYWKSWVVRENKTGVPAAGDTGGGKVDSVRDPHENEDEDAGVPTPDTPEVIGRYANVAYEMGSGALPPILQRHSPGHEGIGSGNKLFFCVVYLAPGDYHRFHSPTSWVVERRRHFRGELYSVSPYVASRLPNLFVLNERVALLGRWRHGFFSMIPVGATNVGSIRINFDKALRTNVRQQRRLAGTYSEASYSLASKVLGGQPLQKGDEMGGFLLGSTIVLVFEAPEEFDFTCKPGQKIKFGERLGDITPE